MILGKRPRRPPIKRTTSMTEFTLDHNHTTAVVPNNPSPPYDHPNNPFSINPRPDAVATTTTPPLDHRLLTATVNSPRNHRRSSMDSPHFLTACHLCRRRLITGRDIFMYRGDRAFCSFECRQQQMNQDEKKEGGSLISKKPETVNTEYSSNNYTSKLD